MMKVQVPVQRLPFQVFGVAPMRLEESDQRESMTTNRIAWAAARYFAEEVTRQVWEILGDEFPGDVSSTVFICNDMAVLGNGDGIQLNSTFVLTGIWIDVNGNMILRAEDTSTEEFTDWFIG